MRYKLLVSFEISEGGELIALTRFYDALKKTHPNSQIQLVSFKGSVKPKFASFSRKIFLKRSNHRGRFAFLSNNFSDFLRIRRSMGKVLQDGDISLVITADYLSTLAAISIHRKKIKLIFTFHGTRSTTDLKYQGINYRQILIMLFEKVSWMFSDIVIVPSYATKIYLLNKCSLLNKEKIRVVPNIVSNDFFVKRKANLNEKSLENHQHILYAGRLFRYKGLLNLVDAFGKFVLTNPKALIDINYFTSNIEEGMERETNSLINRLNISHKVRIIKDPTKRMLLRSFRNSDLLVLPSELENSPMVVRESFACGTPVLGTSVGDVGELISDVDKNLILKDNTSEEILRKFKYFFSLKLTKRKCIIEKSLSVGKKFTATQALSAFDIAIKNI